jgi:hypothetical protein
MENISERNRLRYAGRIPQETLGYLAAKKKEDSKFRIREIPVLVIATVILAFLIARVLRNDVAWNSRSFFLTFVAICFLVNLLRNRIRSYIA